MGLSVRQERRTAPRRWPTHAAMQRRLQMPADRNAAESRSPDELSSSRQQEGKAGKGNTERAEAGGGLDRIWCAAVIGRNPLRSLGGADRNQQRGVAGSADRHWDRRQEDLQGEQNCRCYRDDGAQVRNAEQVHYGRCRRISGLPEAPTRRSPPRQRPLQRYRPVSPVVGHCSDGFCTSVRYSHTKDGVFPRNEDHAPYSAQDRRERFRRAGRHLDARRSDGRERPGGQPHEPLALRTSESVRACNRRGLSAPPFLLFGGRETVLFSGNSDHRSKDGCAAIAAPSTAGCVGS